MHTPPLKLLRLHGVPIEQQLYLEEALLRIGQGNWCIVNTQAPPAIVMGVSGRAHEWIDLDVLKSAPIPVIQRYSGGGTVVIGPETLLVSFIMSQDSLPHVELYPHALMEWSSQFYAPLFTQDFARIEQDYTLNGKKCGGNAQYLAKLRWVHHTSWLWNYTAEQMCYLKPPPKQPTYRQNRSHLDFLTPLSRHFSSTSEWLDKFSLRLHALFNVEQGTLEEVNSLQQHTHRLATRLLTLL